MANFQDLIHHWSLTFHSNELQHHRRLDLSFPKWYDTCIFVEKCPHNSLKYEELRFWSKFWQNFKELFGALTTLFWCNQRYRWMPPYGYSRFLTPKTNLENHHFHLPKSDPINEAWLAPIQIVFEVIWEVRSINKCPQLLFIPSLPYNQQPALIFLEVGNKTTKINQPHIS